MDNKISIYLSSAEEAVQTRESLDKISPSPSENSYCITLYTPAFSYGY